MSMRTVERIDFLFRATRIVARGTVTIRCPFDPEDDPKGKNRPASGNFFCTPSGPSFMSETGSAIRQIAC
jgi:hypothetical protein